jgi:hypothetical protein
MDNVLVGFVLSCPKFGFLLPDLGASACAGELGFLSLRSHKRLSLYVVGVVTWDAEKKLVSPYDFYIHFLADATNQ